MLGTRRQVAVAVKVAQHLALVFLQQAVRVVLRMPLEVHPPEPIVAHRGMHAGFIALDEDLQASRDEMLAQDGVVAGVRHVEAGVDVAQQRMRGRHDTVAVDPPLLARQRDAVDAVQHLHQRVRGEARAERRGDVLGGPADDLRQRLVERLEVEARVRDVGAGDDERVETVGIDRRQVFVMRIDVGLRRLAARQPGHGEAVHVELRDVVRTADQPHELLLGHLEGGVRHHVQEADVQGSNVLALRLLRREHGVPVATQVAEGRQ